MRLHPIGIEPSEPPVGLDRVETDEGVGAAAMIARAVARAHHGAARSGCEAHRTPINGETDPVTKKPGDQLLSGSFVVSGSGAFSATRVGRRSYAAQLEGEASAFSLAHSELMAGINRFLRLITWVIVPVAILLTASQLAYANGAFSDAVAGAVAGIITMIPEGLVLLTSVAFAVGVVRLGRRR